LTGDAKQNPASHSNQREAAPTKVFDAPRASGGTAKRKGFVGYYSVSKKKRERV